MTTYTILTKITPFTKAISHIQMDIEGESKTLCGKELGFAYEVHEDNITIEPYSFLNREEILKLKFSFCKTCYKILKNEHLEIHKS